MKYLLELNDKIEFAQKQIEKAQNEVQVRSDELQKLRSMAWFCNSCKKYYHKDSVTTSQEEETHTETVYVDAGYGDDDELGEVTRLFTYNHCPVCGMSEKISKGEVINISNRRKRRE